MKVTGGAAAAAAAAAAAQVDLNATDKDDRWAKADGTREILSFDFHYITLQ